MPWRAIFPIALLYSARMYALFLVLPVLALMETQFDGGHNALWVGLALGGYGLTQGLLQIPFGILSDRFGRRPMILLGLALFVTGSLVAAWADSMVGVFVGRVLQGMGAVASVLMALLSDLTTEEQRAKSMAIIGATIGLSFFAAMATGPQLFESMGLSGLFYVSAALGALGCVVVFLLPKQNFKPSLMPLSQLRDYILTHRPLWQLNLGVFVLHFVLMASFVVIPTRLTGFGIEAGDHGSLYLLLMGLSFLVAFPLIGWCQRAGHQAFAFKAAVLILIAGVLGWSLVEQVVAFKWMLGLFFVGFNLMEALLPASVSKVVTLQTRGSAMGVYSSCQFFGAFCGGALGGLAATAWGVSGVMVAMLCMLGFWAIVLFLSAKTRTLSAQPS